eukprot:scaffold139082_cov13-Tisochrysis_lutea.AAC.1
MCPLEAHPGHWCCALRVSKVGWEVLNLGSASKVAAMLSPYDGGPSKAWPWSSVPNCGQLYLNFFLSVLLCSPLSPPLLPIIVCKASL